MKPVIGRQPPPSQRQQRSTARGRTEPGRPDPLLDSLLGSRLGTARKGEASSGNFGRRAGADRGAYLRADGSEVARTLEAVFEAFPRLRERHGQRAGSLSGGEQQMLAIGRALMASPRLILADEMSQGLAPVIVQEVYRRLLEVNRRGVTILLVEQNARLAFKLAQFVYVMEQGRVALEGPSAEVAASEHVQRAYLGVA